jgi:hypothetical protein
MSEKVFEELRIVEESVDIAKKRLEGLSQYIESLKNDIINNIAVKIEEARYTRFNPESLPAFLEEPYLIIPKRQEGEKTVEWYVIVPRFIDFQLGWLERSTKSYNIFLVNQYVQWFTEIPKELKERFQLKPLPIKVADGLLLTTEEAQEEAWNRYRKFLHVREGKEAIRVKRGSEFQLIAQIIEDGSLPFIPKKVDQNDLRPPETDIQLRDYQEEGFNKFLETGALGIYWPFGAGKSFFGAYVCAALKGRKLVIVPTITLKEQWLEYISKHTKVPYEVQIETYHAFDKIKNNTYTLTIYDECLPYETKILTEQGYRCIGQVVENKEKLKVASLKGQEVEWKPITFWFKKYANRLIAINRQILLTPTHRVLTPRGLVPAEDLKVGATMYASGDMNEEMFLLRQELYQHIQSLETPSQGSWNQASKHMPNLQCNLRQSLSAWGACKSCPLQPQCPHLTGTPLEIPESRAIRGFQKDVITKKACGVEPKLEGRKTSHDCEEDCISPSGGAENMYVMRRLLSGGVRCPSYRWESSEQYKRKPNHTLSLLPRKYSSRRNQSVGEYGSSLFANGAVDPVLQVATIFEIENIKLHSPIPVYDIEVADNHNFLAQGFWVSNCQHLPANTFIRLATVNTKYRLGFSGSPYREDGRVNYIIALTGYPLGLAWEKFFELGIIKKPSITLFVLPSARDKLRKLDELLSKELGKTIVFCDSIELGQKIAKDYGLTFVFGQTTQRLEKIRENERVIVSRVGDEGISIPEIDTLIEVDFLYGSRRQESQRSGRLLHSTKEATNHYILMTEEELEKYGKRLLVLYEKGYRVNIVR